MSQISRALSRRSKGQQGFTLIELLVVVIIIGILAAVSVPIYLNQKKKAWDATAISDLKNAQLVMESDFDAINTSIKTNTGGAATITGSAWGKNGSSGSCHDYGGGDKQANNYFRVSEGNCLVLASTGLEYTLYSCSSHDTGNCYMYSNTETAGVTRISPSQFAANIGSWRGLGGWVYSCSSTGCSA